MIPLLIRFLGCLFCLVDGKVAALDRDNDSSAYTILYRSGYEYSVSSFTVIKKSIYLGFPIIISFKFWKQLWFLAQIE